MRGRGRALWLTGGAMIAFASNSILCRLALREGAIDAASFTGLRLFASALMLSPLLLRQAPPRWSGILSWAAGVALFTYAAAFSFAYVRLTTAGAAILLGISIATRARQKPQA